MTCLSDILSLKIRELRANQIRQIVLEWAFPQGVGFLPFPNASKTN